MTHTCPRCDSKMTLYSYLTDGDCDECNAKGKDIVWELYKLLRALEVIKHEDAL